jgi:patatin-like phospholipase/acyl hydrolase
MLNEPRVSRKERLEKGKQVQQKVTKAAPTKKETKKANEEVEVKQAQVNFPKSHEHHMEEVHSFLQKLESETIKHEYASHQGLINIRSHDEHH